MSDVTPETAERLARLRDPFPDSHIAYRPQVWCGLCRKAPSKVCGEHHKIRCERCGQYITNAHLDLSYVGHAETTDRLLASDPEWTWAPMARDVDPQVLAAACASGNPEIVRMVLEASPPKLDRHGGMWILLTVHGVTRPGYGDAAGKEPGPAAIKEVIGDAIRNAAMRFGVALDLWSKSDMGEIEAERLASRQDQAAEGPTRHVESPHSSQPAHRRAPAATSSQPRTVAPVAPQTVNEWRRAIAFAAIAAGFATADGKADRAATEQEYTRFTRGGTWANASMSELEAFAAHLETLAESRKAQGAAA